MTTTASPRHIVIEQTDPHARGVARGVALHAELQG